MKNSSALDLTNDSLLTSLLNLIINYLDRCYREKHVYDVQKLSTFVNQIADEYPIIFHKLIVKYYVALLEKNEAMAEEIKDLLCQSGYQRYVAILPETVKEN